MEHRRRLRDRAVPTSRPRQRLGPLQPGVTSQTLSVSIVGDTTIEWNSTLQLDEVFFVDLGTPTNATLLKSRATVTIVDDDRTLPGLQLVSAVADGAPGHGAGPAAVAGAARAASGAPSDVLVRWNVGAELHRSRQHDRERDGRRVLPLHGPRDRREHAGRDAGRGAPQSAARPALLRALRRSTPRPPPRRSGPPSWPRPSTRPPRSRWRGPTRPAGLATSVVPPTVGVDAVYTVSTDGVVHAMRAASRAERGPPAWNPVALGKPAHNRSPVVPLPEGSRLFVGTESGEVHAVDGTNGSIVWSRSAAFSCTALPNTGGVQGTPAGLFKACGGLNDAILVGIEPDGQQHLLHARPRRRARSSIPTATRRWAASRAWRSSTTPATGCSSCTTSIDGTLWGLRLGPAGVAEPDGPQPRWSVADPVRGSARTVRRSCAKRAALLRDDGRRDVRVPAVRRGRKSTPLGHGDGEVKGFVFPDRRNGDIYLLDEHHGVGA